MNQGNQGNNPDASANIPIKRKRGRPRKYPRPNFNHGENAVTRDHNLNRRENAHRSPGFGSVNGNHSHQVHSNNDTNDVMVGQVVYGVIEAAFDAGYLLTVKVGNSETTLRGVVFKPGHYIPVSADNDVAPNVQMVRRNQIPFPVEHHPRSRERSEQHVNSYRNGTANLGASKSKQAASVVVQTAHSAIPRNNTVPVELQPDNLSNGGVVASEPSSVAIQAPCPEASKGKQVLETAHPSNGSTPTTHVQAVGNQVLPLQAQNNHQGVPNQPPAEVLHEAEAKSMKMPGMPFEKLLTEVIKRIQAPSQSAVTQFGNIKDDTANTDQALSIEPLQAVQPDPSSQSVSLSKPFEKFRTGKMTELLRAVQENMMESQLPKVELTTSPELSIDNLRSPEAEIGDLENVHSKKDFQASNA